MTVDVERFRAALLEERHRVQDAIQYIHDEHPDTSDEMNLSTHLMDNAALTTEQELDDTLEENSSNVLAEIDAALERIDAGTYGTFRLLRNRDALPRVFVPAAVDVLAAEQIDDWIDRLRDPRRVALDAGEVGEWRPAPRRFDAAAVTIESWRPLAGNWDACSMPWATSTPTHSRPSSPEN